MSSSNSTREKILGEARILLRTLGEREFEAKSRKLRSIYEEAIRGFTLAKKSSLDALGRFQGDDSEFVRGMDALWLESWSRNVSKARFAYEAHHALVKNGLTEREIETARTCPIGRIVSVPRSGFILCPFHKEKTPSCKVKGNLWYCHGCAQGGDVIDFVRKRDGLGFKEAVKMLVSITT